MTFRPTTCLAAMAIAVASAIAASPAHAAPVRYDFTGTVDSDDADRGYSGFSGHFVFDSGASDAIADVSTAAYGGSGAPWLWSIAFDGQAAVTIDAAMSLLVTNDLGGSDQLGVLADDGAQSFSLALFDFTQALFGSDALPLPAGGLTLADFGWSSLFWAGVDGTLQGRLNALACVAGCDAAGGGGGGGGGTPPTQVPEPHGGALAALALLLMRALPRQTAPSWSRA